MAVQMKTEVFEGKVESFYGKTLDKALPFNGTYEAYADYASVVEANDLPSNDDIVDFVNNRRKQVARQQAMKAVTDAAGLVKPTLENDENEQFKAMVKIYTAKGKTPEQAAELAKAALSL